MNGVDSNMRRAMTLEDSAVEEWDAPRIPQSPTPIRRHEANDSPGVLDATAFSVIPADRFGEVREGDYFFAVGEQPLEAALYLRVPPEGKGSLTVNARIIETDLEPHALMRRRSFSATDAIVGIVRRK
jgi:hypothetical protein